MVRRFSNTNQRNHLISNILLRPTNKCKDYCVPIMTFIPDQVKMTDPMDRRCKLRELNEMITCKICQGYLVSQDRLTLDNQFFLTLTLSQVDATTVTECLHTFCKSCIVKHLEDSNTCPECDDVIHQSHPLDYIAYDRTLQDLVSQN